MDNAKSTVDMRTQPWPYATPSDCCSVPDGEYVVEACAWGPVVRACNSNGMRAHGSVLVRSVATGVLYNVVAYHSGMFANAVDAIGVALVSGEPALVGVRGERS